MEKTKIFIIDLYSDYITWLYGEKEYFYASFLDINNILEAVKTYILNAVTNLANQSQYNQIVIIYFSQTSLIVYKEHISNLKQIKQVIDSLNLNEEDKWREKSLENVTNLVKELKRFRYTSTFISPLDVIIVRLANENEEENPKRHFYFRPDKIYYRMRDRNTSEIFLYLDLFWAIESLINGDGRPKKVAFNVKVDEERKFVIIDYKSWESPQENKSVEEEAVNAIAATNQIYNSQLASFNSKNQGIERTKFTLIYPEIVIARRWYSLDLLIYVDSLSKTIKNICSKLIKKRNLIEETEYINTTMPCTNIIPKGSEITVKINSKNISVNPEYISLKWHEPYYNFSFRICCSEQQIDDCDVYIKNYGDISVDVYIDNLPVLSIPLNLEIIQDNDELNDKVKDTKYDFLDFQWVEQIFASYAPEDEHLVKIVKEQYEVIGINMLTDLKQYHQAFERGKYELSNKIEQSDIFQLFWSSFAQVDKNVETEYQQALNLIKNQKKNQNFITPLYWEEPIPSIPSKLSNFYFYRLRLLTTEQTGNELEREREHNQTLSEIAKIQAS
ncbi:MAG: TIR domain-containing protein, partial [Planktothrix sp.]